MSLILTRTPYRVSFFGGGTDYPEWYRQEGGAVLSSSIDKYCYITARHHPEFFPTLHRVVWKHIETVESIADILHPAVREGLKKLGFDDSRGVEILHQGDLPARTGVGSSSAFAVGLILALRALQGEMMDKTTLYREAIDLEQQWIKDAVGSQDQVAVAQGGMNFIEFGKNGDIDVQPVKCSPQRLQVLKNNLMLFYTGSCRMSSEVSSDVVANIPKRATVLREMKSMAYEARDILEGSANSLSDFGRLLDKSWSLKKRLSDKISNPTIDSIYSEAKKAGAIGGKLLGAGHSGFVLLFVPEAVQESVRTALKDLLEVDFAFETEGSKVIYDLLRPENKNSVVRDKPWVA